MKKILLLPLFLCILGIACQKENEPKKEVPKLEEPEKTRNGYLELEIEGKKYVWKGTEPGFECFGFQAIYNRRQELLTFSVSESELCAGRNEQMSFGVTLTARSIGGVYRIEPSVYNGDNFQFDLKDQRYSAASWQYVTDLEVVITSYDPRTGLIEGTLGGTVAKFFMSGNYQSYSKMVPIKGVFTLNLLTLNG